MKILFKAYFGQPKFPDETCLKIYLGQDPELDPHPDVFKSRIRIRNTALINTPMISLAYSKC
jgi:hypothetical protein